MAVNIDDNVSTILSESDGETVVGAIVSAMVTLNNVVYPTADISGELNTIRTSPEGSKIRTAIKEALLKMASSPGADDVNITELPKAAYNELNPPDESTLYGIVEDTVYALLLDTDGAPTTTLYTFDSLRACSIYLKYADGLYAVRNSSSSAISENMFEGFTTIKEFQCGSEDRAIYAETFKNCSNLTKVTIGDLVHGIGDEAFYGTAIESVLIPYSVAMIGTNVFANCNNLTTIIIDNEPGSISGAPWGAENATVTWLR